MRSDVQAVLVALAAVWVAGCASGLEGAVRSQAAIDLVCPERQVSVRGLRGDEYVRDFEVEGCGRRARYQGACSVVGSCTAYRAKQRGEPTSGEAPTAEVPEPPPPLVVVTPDGNTLIAEAEREVAVEPEPEEVEREDAEAAVAREVAAPSGEARAVTLRNACPRTVALFVGAKPGAEDGRYMSLGSNSSISPKLRTGELLWLLDAEQAGVASVAIAGGTREVEVAEGCAGLTAR